MKQKQWLPKERKRLLNDFGSWAVLTGASSGIGLELAHRLAEAGFNLLMNSRNIEDLKRVQAQLQAQYPVVIKTVAADVGTEEGVLTIISSSEAIDAGLFIAAAGFGTSGAFIHSTIELEANLVRVNCEGLLRLTHHFCQRFARQRRGGIILLSSIVAFQGVPYSANYAASKAYVHSFAEALSRELKPFNVHVLATAPGPVSSGFGVRANMHMNITLSPSEISIPILHALGRRSTVFPGLLTKILHYSLELLPRWVKVKIMGTVMHGFTKHQQFPLPE